VLDEQPAAAPPPVELRARPDSLSGRWGVARDLDDEQRGEIDRLNALGYLAGSRPAPEQTGVVIHVRDEVQPGLNFVVSGHAPGAQLLDMDGNVLHEWRCDFPTALPELPERAGTVAAQYWRRAWLFPDGDVIAIFDGQGILRVDRDSNLRWASGLRAHHDLQVTPDGTLWVLTREAHVIPRVQADKPVVEDFFSVVDPETGRELRRISLLECFEHSGAEHSWVEAYRQFWKRQQIRRVPDTDPQDLFHANGFEVLDGRIASYHPAFVRGALLVTMRNLDMVAVIDPDAQRVLWSMAGNVQLPHDPSITPAGGLMVFDNHWIPLRASAVTVFDPRDGRVEWSFHGAEEQPFYSHACGTAAALGNGNVLIAETDNGRALEVTPDRRIVWEYANPHRAGDDGELIASLLDVVRVPPDFGAGWLAR